MKAKLEKTHKLGEGYHFELLESGYTIQFEFDDYQMFTYDHDLVYSGPSLKEGRTLLGDTAPSNERIKDASPSLELIIKDTTYHRIKECVRKSDGKIMSKFDPKISLWNQDIAVSPSGEYYMTVKMNECGLDFELRTDEVYECERSRTCCSYISEIEYNIFDAKGLLLTQFTLTPKTFPTSKNYHMHRDGWMSVPSVVLHDKGYTIVKSQLDAAPCVSHEDYIRESAHFDFSGKRVDELEELYDHFDSGKYYAKHIWTPDQKADEFIGGKVRVYASKTHELVFEFEGDLTYHEGGFVHYSRIDIKDDLLALKKKDTIEIYRLSE